MKLQGLGIYTDLTSGLNLYPDLRLIDNVEPDYAASLKIAEEVLAKMRLIGSRDLILALHRFPENNFTREQTWASFEKTLRRICEHAAEIKVHLRVSAGRPPASLKEAAEFVGRINAPNLRIAPGTALLLASAGGTPSPEAACRDKIGIWLLSTPATDLGGSVWGHHAPIANDQWQLLSRLRPKRLSYWTRCMKISMVSIETQWPWSGWGRAETVLQVFTICRFSADSRAAKTISLAR